MFNPWMDDYVLKSVIKTMQQRKLRYNASLSASFMRLWLDEWFGRYGTSVQGAKEKIHEAVMQWDGVTAQPHRFGGTEYLWGERREIGHIHGNALVDIPFPKKVRDEVVAAGRAKPHHILPDSGWISFYLNTEADVAQAIELLRLSYDVTVKQKRRD